MLISEQQLSAQDLRHLLHIDPSDVLLPNTEILPYSVLFEETEFSEFAIQLSLFLPLVDGDEYRLILVEVRDASS